MITVIGSLAALLTTACWLPQLVKTVGKGTAEDFAWPYLFLLVTGVSLWFAYGVLRDDAPIYLCNGFTGLFVLAIAAVKIRSRHVRIDGLDLVVPHSADPADTLASLVALGPALAGDLDSVGIPDAATLQAVGADEAARRLEAAGRSLGSPERAALAGLTRHGRPSPGPGSGGPPGR